MASVSSTLGGSIGGNYISHTSQLINDGAFPDDNSKFVETFELNNLVHDIVVDIELADKNHTKEFSEASTVWRVDHLLKKVCAITCRDTAGTEINGRVVQNDGATVIVQFNVPLTGSITLN